MALPGFHPVEQRNPEVALRAKVAQLEKRIATLERESRIPMTASAPTNDTGRDGSLAGTPDLRMWLKIDGVWRYTNVT